MVFKYVSERRLVLVPSQNTQLQATTKTVVESGFRQRLHVTGWPLPWRCLCADDDGVTAPCLESRLIITLPDIVLCAFRELFSSIERRRGGAFVVIFEICNRQILLVLKPNGNRAFVDLVLVSTRRTKAKTRLNTTTQT